MTIRLRDRDARAVLLDIEGTTTPIAFVHDVLFPFARAHLQEYLGQSRGSPDMRAAIDRLRAEHADDVSKGRHPPDWPAHGDPATQSAAYVIWLMDQDRKSPGLKLLQGQIWERGYRSGLLRGQVFPDVAPALRTWHDAGFDVAIYSSGSVLAQRLLFESTEGADLMPLLTAFFDTDMGAKTSSESYTRIARALKHEANEIVFISDVTVELAAARAAGLQVVLSIRPGNITQPNADEFESIESLGEISV